MRVFEPPRILNLSNEQRLGVLRYGRVGGIPVLVTHGFPGSCLQGLIFSDVAEELGLDVVTFDRPGYGDSTVVPFGDMASVLERWREGLELLGVGAGVAQSGIHVVGISGGAPFAKAWAHAFPAQTLSLNLVGGIGDLGGDSYYDQKWLLRNLLRVSGWLPRFVFLKILKRLFLQRSFEDVLVNLGSWLSEPDRAILNDREIRGIFLNGMKRARQQGVAGLARDILIFRNWRTPLENLRRVPIVLWHGRLDNIVSVKMAERFHAAVPSARLEIMDQEGHYSLPVHHAHKIAMEIVRRQGRSEA